MIKYISESLIVGIGEDEKGRGKNQRFHYNLRDFIKCRDRNCISIHKLEAYIKWEVQPPGLCNDSFGYIQHRKIYFS